MSRFKLTITAPRPYFAEIPYYLWGPVNYDSQGDCKSPTDTNWTELDLTHRKTDETLAVIRNEDVWDVYGDAPLPARASKFLIARSQAVAQRPPTSEELGGWDHHAAMARAARVAGEFADPRLAIFDSHHFWGSWKWIGHFATDCTWTGRMIMHAVRAGDPRGVPLCIDWLRHGTYHPDQSKALRQALVALTGRSFSTDAAWIKWYDGGWLRKGANRQYPTPNLDEWVAELRAEYPDA